MSSLLWGPLYFVFDVSPENQVFGYFAIALFASVVIAAIRKPNYVTTLLLFVAVILWIACGEFGKGINC
jgi:hypothetical protein